MHNIKVHPEYNFDHTLDCNIDLDNEELKLKIKLSKLIADNGPKEEINRLISLLESKYTF